MYPLNKGFCLILVPGEEELGVRVATKTLTFFFPLAQFASTLFMTSAPWRPDLVKSAPMPNLGRTLVWVSPFPPSYLPYIQSYLLLILQALVRTPQTRDYLVPQVQSHVWVRGGCESGRCDRCQKKIRIYHSLSGLHCVWCHLEVSWGNVPLTLYNL